MVEKVHEQILDGGQAVGFVLEAGQHLRITDLVGQQIGTMTAFAAPADGAEFSWKRSIARALSRRADNPPGYAGLFEGDLLLSADGAEIMRIAADTMAIKGITNVHATVCNRHVEVASGSRDRDYCYEAAYRAAEPWGLELPAAGSAGYPSGDLLDRLDLFAKPQDESAEARAAEDPDSKLAFGADGRVKDYAAQRATSDKWQILGESVSRPGDYLEFEALADCLVTCANCIYGDANSMKIEFLA